MSSVVSNATAVGNGTTDGAVENKAQTKNYFAYHGGGKDPNVDSWPNSFEQSNVTGTKRLLTAVTAVGIKLNPNL